MTSLVNLLKQIKEKEEHDLEYTKKIKEVEGLLKAELETLKKLKLKQKKLSGEIPRRHLTCSGREITRIELLHEKQAWEDLLQDVHRGLSLSEANLDELQQTVCLDRLSFCNKLKTYVDKYEIFNVPKGEPNKSGLPTLTVSTTTIKIEQDEDNKQNLEEEFIILENQLEELKTERIKIEEAKVMKIKLEAEPTCGKEFLRCQKMLKEARDNLKRAEEEETYLKMKITQKEVVLLRNKSLVMEDTTAVSPVIENISKDTDMTLPLPRQETTKSTSLLERPSVSKTVTFNNTVETKPISPPLQYKTSLKSKSRIKSPSAALRNKLTQQLTSQLDETMRAILFKDETK
ncbi:uncharacterized protein LOC128986042 [Macrosteles quadrilineatus]|uniref:uncharacterized protein LOC128986042 n=1 Tax=Macrosteles quadrilineatus TaxID=74068 RepID=UPI0023E1FBB8|nr:uncharacterized protein LOC128986042 [Macrosteles quadrilineatus]